MIGQGGGHEPEAAADPVLALSLDGELAERQPGPIRRDQAQPLRARAPEQHGLAVDPVEPVPRLLADAGPGDGQHARQVRRDDADGPSLLRLACARGHEGGVAGPQVPGGRAGREPQLRPTERHCQILCARHDGEHLGQRIGRHGDRVARHDPVDAANRRLEVDGATVAGAEVEAVRPGVPDEDREVARDRRQA